MEDVDHLFAKNEETRRELSVAYAHDEKVENGHVQNEILDNKATNGLA